MGRRRVTPFFAEDAFVNDARRELRGIDAIRARAEREMVGDKVTVDVREVVDHSRTQPQRRVRLRRPLRDLPSRHARR